MNALEKLARELDSIKRDVEATEKQIELLRRTAQQRIDADGRGAPMRASTVLSMLKGLPR